MTRVSSTPQVRSEARTKHLRRAPWGLLSLGVVVALGSLAVGLAQAAEPGTEERQAVMDVVFPPDPVETRDMIVNGCTACHGLGLTLFVVDYFDADQWEIELGAHERRGDLRIARVRGEEDVAAVTAYLQKYFVMGRELPEDIPDWLIGEVEAY